MIGMRLREICARFAFFRQLPSVILDALIQNMRIEKWDSDSVIFKEGELDPSILIIMSGSVSLFSQVAAATAQNASSSFQEEDQGAVGDDFSKYGTLLTTLGEGGVTGELSFNKGLPRSATAVCLHPTAVARLTRDVYVPLMSRYHQTKQLNEGPALQFPPLQADFVIKNLERPVPFRSKKGLSQIYDILVSTLSYGLPETASIVEGTSVASRSLTLWVLLRAYVLDSPKHGFLSPKVWRRQYDGTHVGETTKSPRNPGSGAAAGAAATARPPESLASSTQHSYSSILWNNHAKIAGRRPHFCMPASFEADDFLRRTAYHRVWLSTLLKSLSQKQRAELTRGFGIRKFSKG